MLTYWVRSASCCGVLALSPGAGGSCRICAPGAITSSRVANARMANARTVMGTIRFMSCSCSDWVDRGAARRQCRLPGDSLARQQRGDMKGKYEMPERHQAAAYRARFQIGNGGARDVGKRQTNNKQPQTKHNAA